MSHDTNNATAAPAPATTALRNLIAAARHINALGNGSLDRVLAMADAIREGEAVLAGDDGLGGWIPVDEIMPECVGIPSHEPVVWGVAGMPVAIGNGTRGWADARGYTHWFRLPAFPADPVRPPDVAAPAMPVKLAPLNLGGSTISGRIPVVRLDQMHDLMEQHDREREAAFPAGDWLKPSAGLPTARVVVRLESGQEQKALYSCGRFLSVTGRDAGTQLAGVSAWRPDPEAEADAAEEDGEKWDGQG